MNTLQRQLVEKFHVAPEEADRMVREAEAKAKIKASIRTDGGPVLVKAAEMDLNDPEVWREEIRKRMQALEVLQEGVKSMEGLAKLLKRIIQAEQKLIGGKTATVNHRGDDWWSFNESGWAMGGREMFAQNIYEIFNNIDEPKLARQIVDKIGFKRSIPVPEGDIPPLAPKGPDAEEPGERGKEEDPSQDPSRVAVPAHVAIEAMLVRGAATDPKDIDALVKQIKLPTGWKLDEDASQVEGVYASRAYRNDYEAIALISDLEDVAIGKSGLIFVSLNDYGGYEKGEYQQEQIPFRSVAQIPGILKQYEKKIVKERPWLVQP